MNANRRRAFTFLGLAAAASVMAVAMVPHEAVAEMTAAVPLASLFPASFESWRIDPDIIPLEPSADLRKVIEESYDQTLARTYVNSHGYRVMLSVAYGGRRNQGMDIHRPEICYPAQGLALRSDTREVIFRAGDISLPTKRLVAGTGNRNEPITYWLVIGRSVASFGYGHRIALLKYGLTGHVPDGMLIRISSIDEDEAHASAEHDTFLRDLLGAITPEFRDRLLGRP